KLAGSALGVRLRNRVLLHGGFFLGPKGFYAALRDLPESERRQFNMTSVSFINQLYGDDIALRIEQRQHARFINTAMMITLTGAAISDGLADGRVVSGVGGQYNFVAMAHTQPGWQNRFQPPVELRSLHDPAPPARCRDHRIRDRGDSWSRGSGSDRVA